MKLKRKVALITGATSGIGEASAMLFAREGAKVTIAARGEAASGESVISRIRDEGGEAVFIQADVSKPADIRALIEKHCEAWDGRLDILFNNAAWVGSGGSIIDTSEEELDAVLATGLKAVFLMCKYSMPIMIKNGGGCIINTTTAAARDGYAWPNMGAYMGSKGGIMSLTRALAMEGAPHKIRSNSLSPGIVASPMQQRFAAAQPNPEAFLEAQAKMHLVGRLGQPEDLAKAALYLASDDSSFVTGIDLLVDGGLILQL